MKLLKPSFLLLLLPLLIFYNCKNLREAYKQDIINHMKQVADWQLAHPKWEKYEWQNAPLYDGIWATYKATGDKKYYQACYDMGEENNWSPGKRWYHADDIAIGHVYLDVYKETKEERFIKNTRDSINKMFTHPPMFDHQELPAGLVSENSNKKINYWWWCDAIYMAPPTLVKLGVYTNEEQYLKLSDSLYQETHQALWDKEEQLYARDLRFVHTEGNPNNLKELNGEKIFWSRGNGWVIGGLVQILTDLPKDWETRKKYEEIYIKLANRLGDLQPKDGLWRSSLLDTENYTMGETSGTAFILYGLTWGVNNGYLDKDKFTPIINKTWKALKNCVDENGMLGYAQPVGEEPLKNFKNTDWEVYASGAFCLAASEMIKYVGSDQFY